jgi:hypothetical protein
MRSLAAPDASGKSFMDQFKETRANAPVKKPTSVEKSTTAKKPTASKKSKPAKKPKRATKRK